MKTITKAVFNKIDPKLIMVIKSDVSDVYSYRVDKLRTASDTNVSAVDRELDNEDYNGNNSQIIALVDGELCEINVK